MRKQPEIPLKKKALWMMEGLGLALAYFGAFAVLMYPVVDAARSMA